MILKLITTFFSAALSSIQYSHKDILLNQIVMHAAKIFVAELWL